MYESDQGNGNDIVERVLLLLFSWMKNRLSDTTLMYPAVPVLVFAEKAPSLTGDRTLEATE